MHVAGGLPDSGTDTRANPGGWVQTECCIPASHVCLGESGAKKNEKNIYNPIEGITYSTFLWLKILYLRIDFAQSYADFYLPLRFEIWSPFSNSKCKSEKYAECVTFLKLHQA